MIVVDTLRPSGRNHIHSLIRSCCRSDPLESITFDVDELSRLGRTEQALRLEEAERQIDEVQRAAADDPDSLTWVEQQRQYLVEMQHLIFEC